MRRLWRNAPQERGPPGLRRPRGADRPIARLRSELVMGADGNTHEGLPAINGGLWIKLTVCGVSRFGYGAADGKTGGDAVKEMIGDALRNAAMRFGAALDLWHKGDLHVDEDEPRHDPAPTRLEHIAEHKDDPFPQGPAKNKTHLKDMGRAFWRDLEACGDPDELECLLADKTNVQLVNQIMKALPNWWDGGVNATGETFEGLEAVIARKPPRASG
jgi:hypothetical protein